MYIDNDGTIYDAALNQANAGDNHNKFYRIQLLVSPSGNYKTWTRWGRVGNQGDNKIFGTGTLHDARLCFEQKFKEKAGNTWANRLEPRRTDTKKPFYTFIERKYKDDSSDDEGSSGISKHARSASPVKKAKSSLPKQVQRLMELIFNQQFFANAMREMDYDAEKLPLGQLSRRTMQKGIEILKEIEELFSNPALADEKHNMTFERAIEECSNAYYTMIPHVFGMRRVPVIATEELLRKEVTLLDSLSDMEIANTIMKDTGEDASINVLDRQFSGLGLQEMTPRKLRMRLHAFASCMPIYLSPKNRASMQYQRLTDVQSNPGRVSSNALKNT